MKKLHICLISDQLIPNYLPIKIYNPDIVLMIETEYTRTKSLGERFRLLIKNNLRFKTNLYSYKKFAPDYDFPALYEYFLDLINDIKTLEADEVTLNVTGGTKLMAIAGFDVLKDICHKVIYTNTMAKSIDIIHAQQKVDFISIKLESLLNVNEYLNAYGVVINGCNSEKKEWKEKAKERKLLTEYMADYFSNNAYFLSVINAKVQNALENKKLKNPEQKFKDIKNKKQKKFLRKCAANNIIEYDEDKTIKFKTVETTNYLGGFWLEEYVYFLLKDLNVDEVQCGVEIEWENKTLNEIDILAIHNNRLLIIECKTRRYGKENDRDNDTFYKLDSVADDLRGLYGEKWLLSVWKIEERGVRRAISQGIKILSGEDIRPEKLKKAITEWMERS